LNKIIPRRAFNQWLSGKLIGKKLIILPIVLLAVAAAVLW
jgi:hypothetical protein